MLSDALTSKGVGRRDKAASDVFVDLGEKTISSTGPRTQAVVTGFLEDRGDWDLG